jgi:hypothetical protein
MAAVGGVPGAIIGFLIGGPVGAVIGGVVGWFGFRTVVVTGTSLDFAPQSAQLPQALPTQIPVSQVPLPSGIPRPPAFTELVDRDDIPPSKARPLPPGVEGKFNSVRIGVLPIRPLQTVLIADVDFSFETPTRGGSLGGDMTVIWLSPDGQRAAVLFEAISDFPLPRNEAFILPKGLRASNTGGLQIPF